MLVKVLGNYIPLTRPVGNLGEGVGFDLDLDFWAFADGACAALLSGGGSCLFREVRGHVLANCAVLSSWLKLVMATEACKR